MKKRIALFVYDFPHLRSQMFMHELYILGYKCTVYAQPHKDLSIAAVSERIFLRRLSLRYPGEIAKAYNWPYRVCEHNDAWETLIHETDRLDKCEVGLIAGARILSEELIASFKKGIINFHPGHIPKVRGLDTPLWAIYDDTAPYITAHWIDARIDAGHYIAMQGVPLYEDDTLIDFNERLFELQGRMLEPVLKAAFKTRKYFPPIDDVEHYAVNRKMTADQEADAAAKFPKWRDFWRLHGFNEEAVTLWLA